MEKSVQKGRTLIFVVMVLWIIFLILHNNKLFFQEYDTSILLNLFRIAIIGPLLYFLYKKDNWARYVLAGFSSILAIGCLILIPFFMNIIISHWPDSLYLINMFLCMLFSALILLFSKDVTAHINSKSKIR